MTDLKPSIIRSDQPTITTIGMELPIIADLGDGWFLAAHPNGAAIVTETSIIVLWTESTETAILPHDWAERQVEGKSQSHVPESVRAKAVEKFERFAWPLVRGQFYTEVNPDGGEGNHV